MFVKACVCRQNYDGACFKCIIDRSIIWPLIQITIDSATNMAICSIVGNYLVVKIFQ